jgi:hypothetical protein
VYRAVGSLLLALEIQPHDATYMHLARLHAVAGNTSAAVRVLGDALQYSPNNTEALTQLGLLLLRWVAQMGRQCLLWTAHAWTVMEHEFRFCCCCCCCCLSLAAHLGVAIMMYPPVGGGA